MTVRSANKERFTTAVNVAEWLKDEEVWRHVVSEAAAALESAVREIVGESM